MTASIIYKGNLRCTATHIQSGTIIGTDAPTDNQGLGAQFSPTDLVCVALATCIITTIAIKATDMQLNLNEVTSEVTKYMYTEPRRIGKIEVSFNFSKTPTTQKERIIIERVAKTCPVHHSLHPSMELAITFTWE